MTLEMILAAMALSAKADRHAGNNYDYDYYEKRRQQEWDDWSNYEKELNEKYPRERWTNKFILRCTVFIPVYNKKIECLVDDDAIRVYNFYQYNGAEVYDMISGFGAERCEDREWYVPPHKFNDHTGELKKDIEQALGLIISDSIYRRDGNALKSKECEDKINSILKSRGIVYDGKFLSFTKITDNTGVGLHRIIAEGVDLKEG